MGSFAAWSFRDSLAVNTTAAKSPAKILLEFWDGPFLASAIAETRGALSADGSGLPSSVPASPLIFWES